MKRKFKHFGNSIITKPLSPNALKIQDSMENVPIEYKNLVSTIVDKEAYIVERTLGFLNSRSKAKFVSEIVPKNLDGISDTNLQVSFVERVNFNFLDSANRSINDLVEDLFEIQMSLFSKNGYSIGIDKKINVNVANIDLMNIIYQEKKGLTATSQFLKMLVYCLTTVIGELVIEEKIKFLQNQLLAGEDITKFLDNEISQEVMDNLDRVESFFDDEFYEKKGRFGLLFASLLNSKAVDGLITKLSSVVFSHSSDNVIAFLNKLNPPMEKKAEAFPSSNQSNGLLLVSANELASMSIQSNVSFFMNLNVSESNKLSIEETKLLLNQVVENLKGNLSESIKDALIYDLNIFGLEYVIDVLEKNLQMVIGGYDWLADLDFSQDIQQCKSLAQQTELEVLDVARLLDNVAYLEKQGENIEKVDESVSTVKDKIGNIKGKLAEIQEISDLLGTDLESLRKAIVDDTLENAKGKDENEKINAMDDIGSCEESNILLNTTAINLQANIEQLDLQARRIRKRDRTVLVVEQEQGLGSTLLKVGIGGALMYGVYHFAFKKK